MDFARNINYQFNHAYHLVEEVGHSIKKEVESVIHHTKDNVNQRIQSISQGCKAAAAKTQDFIYRNKNTIFFIGCCALTAYFAPTLFFPVAVATIILRVELSQYLKHYANIYLKDQVNPYKLNPYYGQYVSAFDITMATIAAIDAVALGTLFIANSWSVALLPVLGGVAFGSSVAKLGMDIATTWTNLIPAPAMAA